MEKALERINQSLEKLVGHHRTLLELVTAERDSLVQVDLKAIERLTLAKQDLVDRIRQEEAGRLAAVATLAAALGTPAQELTLTALLKAAREAGCSSLADRLHASREALMLLARGVSERNQENEKLVARSLRHIQQMKKNILGEGPSRAGTTYTPRGTSATGAAGARLISREA